MRPDCGGAVAAGDACGEGLRLSPVFSEQGSEAGLLEVPVVGQRLGYVPLLHDKKAGAVGEAP